MASSRKVDDVRLLRLLWRGAEEPSARSGLTVGRIVDAGVRVADAEGLEAVSMRRVAAELKVGAMSLYTYVPGKEELVYLMFDQVYGELDVERSREGSWRQRLEAFARAHWDLLHAHPWLLDVPLRRPVVGPNASDLFEYQLSIVDGIGLDPLEMNATLDLVNEFVAGAASRQRAIRRDAEESGISDEEWWYRVSPTLTEVMADRHYPLSHRVGTAVAAPHLETTYLLDFGLARILDGLERLVESRGAEARGAAG